MEAIQSRLEGGGVGFPEVTVIEEDDDDDEDVNQSESNSNQEITNYSIDITSSY